MDEVREIFKMKKCLLNVWEAMKGDAYMQFAVIQLIPLFNKLEYPVTGYMGSNPYDDDWQSLFFYSQLAPRAIL